MSDGIFNATGGMCEDEDDLDVFDDEDEEVECYNDCNGFCTIYGQRCSFEGDEKLDCEMFEEELNHDM